MAPPIYRDRYKGCHKGFKRCSRCGIPKRIETEFSIHRGSKDGRSFACIECLRKAGEKYRATEGYKVMRAEYFNDPETRRRRSEYQKRSAQHPHRKAQQKAWRQTVKGKLISNRISTLAKFRKTTDPIRRTRYLALAAAYDQEIARLEAR